MKLEIFALAKVLAKLAHDGMGAYGTFRSLGGSTSTVGCIQKPT